MSNTTLNIFCQQKLPHSYNLKTRAYDSFCTIEIQLQEEENGNVQNIIFFLPPIMFEHLTHAATAFNTALAELLNKEY